MSNINLHCLIVDDEPIAIDVLEDHIQKYPGLILAKKCNTALDAIDYLRDNMVDVIFLDIMMPRINGIQFLNSLQYPPLIIFTTAHRKYALDGYDFNIIDFLLKPISFERFAKGAEKIFQYKKQNNTPSVQNEWSDDEDKKIFIRSGTKMVRVAITDIMYIEGMRDYLKLYTVKGDIIVVKKTMKSIEQQFTEYDFVRVHKSYIVCTRYIHSVMRDRVKIKDEYIPIGRNYKQLVKNILDENKVDL